MRDSPGLAARLLQARRTADDGKISFVVEGERIKSVIMKLARGHAAFELSESKREEPSHLMITPLHLLTPEARRHFETPPAVSIWPEIGSRAMQRMAVAWDTPSTPFGSDWVDVQEGQYRYMAVAEHAVMIRLVVGEYLGCEVIWGDESL